VSERAKILLANLKSQRSEWLTGYGSVFRVTLDTSERDVLLLALRTYIAVGEIAQATSTESLEARDK
jgi:hypothetical protein